MRPGIESTDMTLPEIERHGDPHARRHPVGADGVRVTVSVRVTGMTRGGAVGMAAMCRLAVIVIIGMRMTKIVPVRMAVRA